MLLKAATHPHRFIAQLTPDGWATSGQRAAAYWPHFVRSAFKPRCRSRRHPSNAYSHPLGFAARAHPQFRGMVERVARFYALRQLSHSSDAEEEMMLR